MAIFGNLNDVSLVDVFRIVRSKSGVLILDGVGSIGEVHIGLHSNHAVFVATNARRLDSREEAAETIRALLRATSGTFRFEAGGSDSTERSFLLPLYPIVQQAAQQDAVSDAELPHPDTSFSVAPTPPAVPDALSATWSRLLPLLRAGTTATQAAHVLGTSVRDMQVTLHRCRTIGLVGLTPTTTDATPGSAYAAPSITTETRSMLRRFMSRLRGRSLA